MIQDRLKALNERLVTKMCNHSKSIKKLNEEHIRDRLEYDGNYRSPLDIIS